jgi:hypothetical protein
MCLVIRCPSAASGYGVASGTKFFEFTSATSSPANSIEQVASQPGASGNPAYVYDLLVLPTGEVLSTNFSATPQIYVPTGSPEASWAPTISAAPSTVVVGATYPISGTQFNGLTQGGYYGDDYQGATNYPLVRITNSSTGDVFYARTFGHSTMSIAPGAPGSTNFTLPADIELGASSLVVVANGIPSAPKAITVIASTYTVSPNDLAFGSVRHGTTSAIKVVTVKNTATSALAITSITFAGANPGQFAGTQDCGTSLAAGASCTVDVDFQPTTTGSLAAGLDVNAGNGRGTQTVVLTGTGT